MVSRADFQRAQRSSVDGDALFVGFDPDDDASPGAAREPFVVDLDTIAAGVAEAVATSTAVSGRYRSGAGFDPWSPATRPIYLDQYWRFFRGGGYTASIGATDTTISGTPSQYASAFNVASSTGFLAGETIVVAPGTVRQQVLVIQSVVSNTINLRNMLQNALVNGDVVRHVWTNDTHPWAVVDNAYCWWMSRALQADYSNGMTLFASGGMGSTYTDANGEANVPAGWESFGTAANTSFVATVWSTSNDPHGRSGSGAYMAAANAGGSGIRTLASIPVTPGQVLQVSMHAKVWVNTPLFSVVDKNATSTVLASLSLGGNSAKGADTANIMAPFTLEFQVPAGVSDIECRITTNGATDIVYFDDLRIIEVQHNPNSGRYVIDDAFLDRPLVWLGDSWGTGTTPESLGTILSTRTGSTVTVVNAAVSGERLDEMINRIATDVIPHGPRACLVQYGANDIAQGRSQANMEADIDTCIATLRAAGIKPIILGIPPITSALATSNARNDQIRARVDLHVR